MKISADNLTMTFTFSLDERELRLLREVSDGYVALEKTLAKEMPSKFGRREDELRSFFMAMVQATSASMQQADEMRKAWQSHKKEATQ